MITIAPVATVVRTVQNEVIFISGDQPAVLTMSPTAARETGFLNPLLSVPHILSNSGKPLLLQLLSALAILLDELMVHRPLMANPLFLRGSGDSFYVTSLSFAQSGSAARKSLLIDALFPSAKALQLHCTLQPPLWSCPPSLYPHHCISNFRTRESH